MEKNAAAAATAFQYPLFYASAVALIVNPMRLHAL